MANYDQQANLIDRQTWNATYSSIAHQCTALSSMALLTLPGRNMEPDATYQGCLLSCELHTVDHLLSGVQAQAILRLRTRGLRNLGIVHVCHAISRLCTRVTQSRDCLRNLEIPRMHNAILRLRKIPRLRGTYSCTCLPRRTNLPVCFMAPIV